HRPARAEARVDRHHRGSAGRGARDRGRDVLHVRRPRGADRDLPGEEQVMLKILGRLSSVNVQKVVWCADELGLAYERTDVGGSFGGNKTPEYLAMNPNGLVPVIQDDGFVLYESNAIVRYLGAKDERATLWPREARKRADVDRWMEWQSTSYTPAMRDAFWQ